MARDTYVSEATTVAGLAGIPFNIFDALISTESDWQPFTVSSKGAIGLTQLMPGTASDLHVNPWDERQNLTGGATYLRNMFDKFGNWRDALAAYNAGPGNISAGYGYADTVLGKAGVSSGPGSVKAIPDSALPSTGNPITDWLRSQFQQMFGGAYVNVPKGTPVGSTVTDDKGNPVGTVGTPASAAPLSPTEMVGQLQNIIVNNAGILAVIAIALLFGVFGVKSFFPSRVVGVNNA